VNSKRSTKIPDHVLPIKFLDDYKRNQEFNDPEPSNPPRKVLKAISPQPTVHQGGNSVEMVDVMNAVLLMEEIGRVKDNLKTLGAQDGKAKAVLRALKRLEEELSNEAPRKGSLKRKGNLAKGKRTLPTSKMPKGQIRSRCSCRTMTSPFLNHLKNEC
jgi:hypothetical protein